MKNFVDLYENEYYKKSFLNTLLSLKDWITEENLLYLIKNIITKDDFKVKNIEQIKKIVFYYFYKKWNVEFDNNYSFNFKKNTLKVNLKFFQEEREYKDFKKYFNLWKNEVFLNKVIDTTIWQNINDFRQWAVWVDNIIDFFIYFLKENFELYSLSWEHFPLFKWLINEIT